MKRNNKVGYVGESMFWWVMEGMSFLRSRELDEDSIKMKKLILEAMKPGRNRRHIKDLSNMAGDGIPRMLPECKAGFKLAFKELKERAGSRPEEEDKRRKVQEEEKGLPFNGVKVLPRHILCIDSFYEWETEGKR